MAPIELTENDFPALYRAADRNSVDAQSRFTRSTKLRLLLLVVAAAFAISSWMVGHTNVGGIISACLFGTALVVEVFLLRSRPDKTWYGARAAAESAKTLTWRFMVGGAPFPCSIEEKLVEERLLKRLRELATDLVGIELLPAEPPPDQITPSMRTVRTRPLQERKEFYRLRRIWDQFDWYRAKAAWNARQALVWSLILASLDGAGLVSAILLATRTIHADLVAVLGAAGAACIAWAQAKQYQSLAAAYSVAAQELATIHSRIGQPQTESEWSSFVDQAEEAISREHTMWRASHSV